MRFDDLGHAWLGSKPGKKWASTEPGTIPLWVADMDFPTPDVVQEAMRRHLDEGDLGYPMWSKDSPLADEFCKRMDRRYSWTPDPSGVREFTDIISGLEAMLYMSTEPGDGVVFHSPTYPPFLATFDRLQLTRLPIPFQRVEQEWRFDLGQRSFDTAKVMVLVNPHNPTGRVLDHQELTQLAGLAQQHDLLVVSDEVHADLAFPGRNHTPFASISEDAATRTITLTSATKAFNLAGIRCAVAHVGSAAITRRLELLPSHLFGVVSNLGIVATLAAWREGDPWLREAIDYLRHNEQWLSQALAAKLPGVEYVSPQATYLAWLDFSSLDLGSNPARALRSQARVRLSPGPDFGAEGEGYARLNFATSRQVLSEAVHRIASACSTG